jgi:acyl-CoA reductase-like NAD-dependent aldehyde dehydrogenase
MTPMHRRNGPDITRAERLSPMGVAEGCRLRKTVDMDEVLAQVLRRGEVFGPVLPVTRYAW